MEVWIGVDVGGKRKLFDVAVVDDAQTVLELHSHLACHEALPVEMLRGDLVTCTRTSWAGGPS
jgi:hypothetical protein